MKNKLFILFPILLVSSCSSPLIVLNNKIRTLRSIKDEDLYLVSNFTDFQIDEIYKLKKAPTNYTNEYDFYLTNVNFSINDEFYIVNSSGEIKYHKEHLYNTIYCSNKLETNNILLKRSGNLDIYIDTDSSKLEVISSAFSILKRQDLNYIRKTVLNLTNSKFLEIKEVNYFKEITAERITHFIDNGLFMTTSDYSINSGYYSPKDTNMMYHYNVKTSAAMYDNPNGTIENVRLDSTTKNVNDFFINGHYFYENAIEFAQTFKFNMIDQVFYSTYSELIEPYIAFTAPLLVIDENVNFTFNKVGLVDLTPTKSQFRLYSTSTEYLKDTANCFSSATIVDINEAHIDALNKYIGE